MNDYACTIAEVIQQENELIFSSFSPQDAFEIGCALIDKAKRNGVSYCVSITLAQRKLFHFSMDGTSANNDYWVSRKENAVYHFNRSSYRLQLELEEQGTSLSKLHSLDEANFASAGGCFPIIIRGVGIVGTIGVSGLPSAEDHHYVTETIREHLQRHR